MITAIVNFPLPATVDAIEAKARFEKSAPMYREMAGLIRKYYLFDGERNIGGGAYLWESREAAEAVYTPEWRKMIEERYGAAPVITFFDTPVIVDNEKNETATF
ncbi:MAG: YdhR family protein [Rhodospirillales bacterium]|nr:YdhR family protein [Rhodospirillales bacterium]MCW8862577.1 YdhR family protein [Rhodospirillales bacterium]MCW9003299.1 YdhR family protein [Rhodospirillales bacterium]